MLLSVVICTHNPAPERLNRTLCALSEQTLDFRLWETLLIDNGSDNPPDLGAAPPNSLLIEERRIGLTYARRKGLVSARGQFVVLVDDDNVLAPDYLETVVRLLGDNPTIGALGGRSLPEFEKTPEAWQSEFYSLLALRDLGDEPIVSRGLRPKGANQNEYPLCSPIGAGMALRREAALAWLGSQRSAQISDRRGMELSSGGDNDIVLTSLQAGWEVGYFPELKLTHLIPSGRLAAGYLERLNYGIQKSWMQVLTIHDANPWPPISGWSLPLRILKAWFSYRPWSSPASRVRWRGACGHFTGRVQAAPHAS